MHTKDTLLHDLAAWGVERDATVLIHSSMKSIGAVEGGADTVLDALIDYFAPGLLVLPTHTWEQINDKNPVFDPETERSCVGLLTNMFRKRPGVLRSWHPTHSVAALGKDAADYVAGEEAHRTPCSRQGCWGKLYDRDASIVFLGCTLRSNTFIHGVEEWAQVPLRLADEPEQLYIRTKDSLISDPQYRHHCPINEVSQHYIKLLPALEAKGIVHRARFGDALCFIAKAKPMADLTMEYLRKNPQLFVDSAPIPEEWYK